MKAERSRTSLGSLIYFAVAVTAAGYFIVAGIQGDYGLFRQIQIDAEAEDLTQERDALSAEVAQLRNRTRRMSDAYLDLDLLDEMARKVLGYVRPDEMILR